MTNIGEKLRTAVEEIRAKRPEIVGLYAAPPVRQEDDHVYCEIFECDEQGKPVGPLLKVVQVG